jgi:hypothetical protein
MSSFSLRPPLPEGLSHSGIQFVLPSEEKLSDAIVGAIAVALQELLPAGDFSVGPDGVIMSAASTTCGSSLWFQVGLHEGIERSNR